MAERFQEPTSSMMREATRAQATAFLAAERGWGWRAVDPEGASVRSTHGAVRVCTNRTAATGGFAGRQPRPVRLPGPIRAASCFPAPETQDSPRPGAAAPCACHVMWSVWMAKEEGIEMEGVVTEVLPDRNYRVMLENGHEILAYAAGKMSKFKIRVLEGDRVSVVLSPYDLTRGRVIYRHK